MGAFSHRFQCPAKDLHGQDKSITVQVACSRMSKGDDNQFLVKMFCMSFPRTKKKQTKETRGTEHTELDL